MLTFADAEPPTRNGSGEPRRWARPDGCAASPHCGLPTPLDHALRPVTTTWRHLGPIGTDHLALASHPVASSRIRGGGGAHICNNEQATAWPALRSYDGWHLDLCTVDSQPSIQAQYLAPLAIWVVAAYAWRHPDGPWVAWVSRLDAPCELSWHFGATTPSIAGQAELLRGVDLVLGRTAHVGRPSRAVDPTWRALADRAITRKAAYPSLSWATIAESLGVHERTLRDYRRDLERERQPALPGLRLILDGGGR